MKKKAIVVIISILSVIALSNFILWKNSLASDNLQFHNWHKTWGGEGNDRGYSICFDDNNRSVYIAGSSYYHDAQELSPIIIQYDQSGKKLWELTWGQDDSCNTIAVDDESNLYVGGDRHDFVSGNSSFFLMKLNKTKQLEWSKVWGLTPIASMNEIALDSQGNVYAVVRSENLNMLRKYNTNGTFLWEDSWARHTSYNSGKIDIDSADNVYVTGTTNEEMYLIKYNSTGNLDWFKTYGAEDQSIRSMGIVVDSWDNIYTCGFEYTSKSDAFIAKFNASGVQLWNKTWGGLEYEQALAIDVDSNGYLYITGYTTSYEYEKLFVLKYSAEGIKRWSNVLDFSVVDYGSDIVVNSIGDIYVTGNTYSISGGTDILIVKMSSTPPPQIPGFDIFPLLMVSNMTLIIIGLKNKKLFKKKNSTM